MRWWATLGFREDNNMALLLGTKGFSELGINTILGATEMITAAKFTEYIRDDLERMEYMGSEYIEVASYGDSERQYIRGKPRPEQLIVDPHCHSVKLIGFARHNNNCPFCGGTSFRANKYRGWDECVGCGSPK